MPTVLTYTDGDGDHYAAPLGTSYDTVVPVYPNTVYEESFDVQPLTGDSFKITGDLNGYLELNSIAANDDKTKFTFRELLPVQEMMKNFNLFSLTVKYENGKITVTAPSDFAKDLESIFGDTPNYAIINYVLTVFDEASGKVAKYNIPVYKFFAKATEV